MERGDLHLVRSRPARRGPQPRLPALEGPHRPQRRVGERVAESVVLPGAAGDLIGQLALPPGAERVARRRSCCATGSRLPPAGCTCQRRGLRRAGGVCRRRDGRGGAHLHVPRLRSFGRRLFVARLDRRPGRRRRLADQDAATSWRSASPASARAVRSRSSCRAATNASAPSPASPCPRPSTTGRTSRGSFSTPAARSGPSATRSFRPTLRRGRRSSSPRARGRRGRRWVNAPSCSCRATTTTWWRRTTSASSSQRSPNNTATWKCACSSAPVTVCVTTRAPIAVLVGWASRLGPLRADSE